MVIILCLLVVTIVTRIIQVYSFIRYVSTKCHIYDWRCVDEDPLLLIEILEDGYYIDAEWSAYNFLYLEGPSPLSMFFSFKHLTMENIYNEEILDRLNRHEIN
jgi:hypothetical protein